MSALSIQVPFPVFQDRDGQPLDNGYVWLGTSSLNPQTNPVVAYYDSALTIVATQPLRTLNGFISRAGSPAQVYVDAVNFSILVQDRQGTTVFSVPEGTGISPNASGVVYDPAGTGAVASTVQTKLRERVSVKDFGAVGDGVTDDTAACQAAVSAVIAAGGGAVFFPQGDYLLNGIAGADGYKNGILIPFGSVNVYPLNSPVSLVGVYGGSRLLAGSNDMVLLRNSRNHTAIENLAFDGNSKTGVIGIGNIPESITQTTTLVSNGYSIINDVTITAMAIGVMYQPGPTVLGADSGCFYHKVNHLLSNQNNLHMWFTGDVTASGNRTTRTTISNSVFSRGNTGVLISKGTEIDFVSTFYEHFDVSHASGSVLPSAVPTAFNYADTNPSNIRLIGGYAEDCDINITSISPEQVFLIGFRHDGAVSTSEAGMLQMFGGRVVIPRSVTGGNPSVYIAGISASYAGFVIDPDNDASKTMIVQTNGSERGRWFNGTYTHKGSLGNIKLDGTGTELSFTYAGSVALTGVAGSVLYNSFDQYVYRSAAGAQVTRLDSTGTLAHLPVTDNAVSSGKSGQRWSAVWAANGTIQTSDPRTKKDVVDSPLGLDFINALRPVAYKFKVGGNKIVGVREAKPAVFNDDGDLIESAETENIIEPQPGKRQHFGFLTTEVKAALGGVDFGGYVKTNPDDPDSEEALRYDEFIAPLVRAVQELTARIKVLEGA